MILATTQNLMRLSFELYLNFQNIGQIISYNGRITTLSSVITTKSFRLSFHSIDLAN